MHQHIVNDLTFYTFAELGHPALDHAVFARHGGVSPGHLASLNMSISVGDSRTNVLANRARAFAAVGRDPESSANLWQVHSTQVVVAETPIEPFDAAPQADTLITNRPEITLFLRFADCVPILLFDPQRRAVGLVHAGWRGTLQNAVGVAVQALATHYGSRPQDIVAGIGPSIGPCHYEVGPEVVAHTQQTFGAESATVLHTPADSPKPHLDLWAANERLLRAAGVQMVAQSQLCTACHADQFFSHRAEHGQTGRFGALIGLKA